MLAGSGAIVLLTALFFLPTASWADSEWGRNPFVFGKKEEAVADKKEPAGSKSGGLFVEMTLAQGDTRLAVVNGRKVKIGDSVDGAIVSAITIDSVTFVKNGRTITRPVGEMDNEAR